MHAKRPPIAYAAGMALDKLGIPEIFVVLVLRLWLLPHCQPWRRWPLWQDAFVQVGISDEGAQGFSALCYILATGALAPLQVNALHCPKLGEYEAWPLQIVALLQGAQTTATRALLVQRCTPAAARLALEPAVVFARALAMRNLWLSGSSSQTAPGLLRVH